MLLIGEDPRKHISDFSNQFQRDFLSLLKTSHGEKSININHFYQEYIANKEHIHMNSTRFPSLTEFAKHLGREGICRVEEGEKGLMVSWIDNSPEALRRQDAIRKKERQDKGDEEREMKAIREQIERAQQARQDQDDEDEDMEGRSLQREDGEKIKLSFGAKGSEGKPTPPIPEAEKEAANIKDPNDEDSKSVSPPADLSAARTSKVTLKMDGNNKPKNVFAAAKKNALSGGKASAKGAAKKPMSEAERIMKEEIERKRLRESSSFTGLNIKRQKVS